MEHGELYFATKVLQKDFNIFVKKRISIVITMDVKNVLLIINMNAFYYEDKKIENNQ